jgi:hypothetical protein
MRRRCIPSAYTGMLPDMWADGGRAWAVLAEGFDVELFLLRGEVQAVADDVAEYANI